MKTFALPILALGVLICTAAFEPSIRAIQALLLIAFSASLVVFWKFAIFPAWIIRGNVATPMIVGAKQIYPLAYLVGLCFLLTAMWAVWWLDLGLSLFSAAILVWYMRRELFVAAVHARRSPTSV